MNLWVTDSDGVVDVPVCHVDTGGGDAPTVSHIHSLEAAHERQQTACGMPVRSRPVDVLGASIPAPHESRKLTSGADKSFQ